MIVINRNSITKEEGNSKDHHFALNRLLVKQ